VLGGETFVLFSLCGSSLHHRVGCRSAVSRVDSLDEEEEPALRDQTLTQVRLPLQRLQTQQLLLGVRHSVPQDLSHLLRCLLGSSFEASPGSDSDASAFELLLLAVSRNALHLLQA